MNYLIWTYLIYGAAALTLTAVLARTLGNYGGVFLKEVFEDRPGMAEAINHLLVIGFYMLNLGYAFLIFETNGAQTAVSAVEVLVTKLGLLLVSLGVIHFVNMGVFWKIRRRAEVAGTVPVRPTVLLPKPPAPQPAMASAGTTTPAGPDAFGERI